MDVDLYELLGLDPQADERQIKKSFRKVSLKYHPDKNPSEEAKEKFHLIQTAVDILLDEPKRKKYDQQRNAKLERIRQTAQKSAERRKLQDDLERREADAKSQGSVAPNIEVLRQAGYRKRKEYEETGNSQSYPEDEEDKRTIKINMRTPKTEAQLVQELSKYGPIEQTIVGKTYAIVVFETLKAAMNYINDQPQTDKFGRGYANYTLDRLRKAANTSSNQIVK